jgi:hypothetical protein
MAFDERLRVTSAVSGHHDLRSDKRAGCIVAEVSVKAGEAFSIGADVLTALHPLTSHREARG